MSVTYIVSTDLLMPVANPLAIESLLAKGMTTDMVRTSATRKSDDITSRGFLELC